MRMGAGREFKNLEAHLREGKTVEMACVTLWAWAGPARTHERATCCSPVVRRRQARSIAGVASARQSSGILAFSTPTHSRSPRWCRRGVSAGRWVAGCAWRRSRRQRTRCGRFGQCVSPTERTARARRCPHLDTASRHCGHRRVPASSGQREACREKRCRHHEWSPVRLDIVVDTGPTMSASHRL